jgi:hypothetical protein
VLWPLIFYSKIKAYIFIEFTAISVPGVDFAVEVLDNPSLAVGLEGFVLESAALQNAL